MEAIYLFVKEFRMINKMVIYECFLFIERTIISKSFQEINFLKGLNLT